MQLQSLGQVLQITPEERRALQLLARGDSAMEVAAALGVGLIESEAQLTRLFAAMGVSSRPDAVASARKRGLLIVEPIRQDPDPAHPA